MFIERLSRFAGVALLFSCIGLLFFACTGDSKPTPFSIGAPIYIGPTKVTVSHIQWEVESVLHRIGTEEIGMVVFVSWDGFESFDKKSRLGLITTFNLTMISLLDSAGNKYRPNNSMTYDFYMYHQQQPEEQLLGFEQLLALRDSGLRDWVVWFTVPRESHNFTLLIKNPDPQEGQPRLAAVLLGQ